MAPGASPPSAANLHHLKRIKQQDVCRQAWREESLGWKGGEVMGTRRSLQGLRQGYMYDCLQPDWHDTYLYRICIKVVLHV